MSDLADVSRKLVAVFAADVEGGSGLMGAAAALMAQAITE